MKESEGLLPVPIIHTRNKHPTILDINKNEAIACDQYVERVKNARIARIATEKLLDLR